MEEEYTLQYTGSQIDELLTKAGNAVLFTGQTLTDQQKTQAKENLGITDSDFFVTATAVLNDEGGTRVTADKTMAQIQAANNAKQSVYLRFPLGALNDNLEATDYLLIPMVFCESYAIGFSLYAGSEAIGNPGNAVFEALMEDDGYFYVTRKEVSGGSGVYVLSDGESLDNVPESAVLVVDPGTTLLDAEGVGF